MGCHTLQEGGQPLSKKRGIIINDWPMFVPVLAKEPQLLRPSINKNRVSYIHVLLATPVGHG